MLPVLTFLPVFLTSVVVAAIMRRRYGVLAGVILGLLWGVIAVAFSFYILTWQFVVAVTLASGFSSWLYIYLGDDNSNQG